ncbi:CHAT domain-containing protein [Leptodesmis sichuanensis]|uniref:CHAT domain-containing protein n=1 Tax=Leptodesmis sichuanensis TaxID=2906798 RepID=UPI00235A00A5|nr:CHAT domain-containing protein [Leptodesmis sichuanensis]
MLSVFYQVLIQPIDVRLRKKGIKNITFIPHHKIHLIPLHALHNSGCYVIGDYTVNYSPSFSILNLCTQSKKHEAKFDQILIIANPDNSLAYAEVEARQISSLFKESRILTQDADPFTVLSSIGDYHCIHFSCHGSFREDSTLKVGLRLAATQNHTGFLSLNQIVSEAKLPIGSTVVLSCCDSIRTVLQETDEFIGLPNAFLIARASNVIGSLWSIDDLSTTLLMMQFYEKIKQGETHEAALRQAQIWLLSITRKDLFTWISENQSFLDPTLKVYLQRLLHAIPSDDVHPFQSPFYWAAFCSIGQ